MNFLPVYYNITDKTCLVVGGGAIAARKAELLLRAGGKVRVVALEIGERLREMADNQNLEVVQRAFQQDDLNAAVCVIAATDNAAINADISRLSQTLNIPVNVVDSPELCSFIMPSVIDRDPVQIAISTGGVSPVLARMLRSKLESCIPGAYGELARLADEYRDAVKLNLPDVDTRRRFWETILNGQVAELVFAGRIDAAREQLQQALENFDNGAARGEVYLVGAGPGDPDLLTFKALRLMQQWSTIVWFRNRFSTWCAATPKRYMPARQSRTTRYRRKTSTSCWCGWRKRVNVYCASKEGTHLFSVAVVKKLPS